MKLVKKSTKTILRKKSPSTVIPYTGEYKGNFPWKPEMKSYTIVDSEEKLKECARVLKSVPFFAFDTETNSLESRGENSEFKCVCVTICAGESYNYYIPLNHRREEDIDRNIPLDMFIQYMEPIFGSDRATEIGHNLKFDAHVIKRVGIQIPFTNVFDTALASFICDENTPNGLKETSTIRMGIDPEHFKEVVNTVPSEIKKAFGLKATQKATYDLVLIDDGAPYALADSFNTFMLYLGFTKELEDEGMDKLYYKMYIPFMETLYWMEERGTSVDIEALEKMGRDMDDDIENLTYKIYELSHVEFNIGSSAQKSLLLFGIDDYTIPWEEYLEKYKRKNAKRIAKSKNGLDVNRVKKNYDAKQVDKERMAILENSFRFKPLSFTDGGSPATDGDSIWKLSKKKYKVRRKQEGVDLCDYLLEYAKISKLRDAFVTGILDHIYDDGKVHASFNQIGTDSGRISVSNPNLQQLPKAGENDKYQIRSVFIGSEYFKSKKTGKLYDTKKELFKAEGKVKCVRKRKKILALDYHNLEMVCLTYFSQDKNLSTMFANDDDAHGSTAVNMFNLDCTPVECKKKYPHLRQAAKTINFMLMYGGGASTLYEALAGDHESPVELGDKSYLDEYHCKDGIEVAQKFIDKYFESYSGVAEFIRNQKRMGHRKGYVNTILGRKRRLIGINSTDGKTRSYYERLSVNSAIQGTAGDITINAQIRLDRIKRLKECLAYMLIQVHDELVWEVPEEHLEEVIPIIKDIMEHPFGVGAGREVPYLRADYDFGNSYQEAK